MWYSVVISCNNWRCLGVIPVDKKNAEQIELSKELFIEKMADNMRTFGLPATVGRIFGIMYLNQRPMTLDQLSEETGMSKTRMSQVIREMIQLNIVEKVYQNGVRKDLYTVEDNYYQIFISLFTSTWRGAINKSKLFENKIKRDLAELRESSSLSEENEVKLNEFITEFESWSEYYNWLSRLVEFLESGEVFKHVPIHNHSPSER